MDLPDLRPHFTKELSTNLFGGFIELEMKIVHRKSGEVLIKKEIWCASYNQVTEEIDRFENDFWNTVALFLLMVHHEAEKYDVDKELDVLEVIQAVYKFINIGGEIVNEGCI